MIYLNGNFLPIEQAYVSVLDRGFIFGDGVYEVIPVYSRKAFRLEHHLARLQDSLNGIRLNNPHTNEEWCGLITQLIDYHVSEDQYIYLHITRGVAKRDHAFPNNTPPTIFMMSNALLTPPEEFLQKGVSAITAKDNRWGRCDIKAISLLPNVLLRQLAIDAGATETILLREGFLTEGAASNIFVVKENKLFAPPKSHLMLPGITYDVVLELVETHCLPYSVRPVVEQELRSADEILLTSSTKEILPIISLDGKSIGKGKPGPFFYKLNQLYQHYKEQTMRGKQVSSF